MADPPQGPPPPDPDVASLPSGGIYVRWRDRLWQEQPDGSFLVWDEATRQWETSQVQPPSEPGRAISTRECPNCGRRVKSTLRSCPYCEYGFEVPSPSVAAPAAATTVPKEARFRGVSPLALLIALLLVVAIIAGLLLKRRSDLCENWKAGVASYTQIEVAADRVPPGMTEEAFRALNEERFANTKPGGCG